MLCGMFPGYTRYSRYRTVGLGRCEEINVGMPPIHARLLPNVAFVQKGSLNTQTCFISFTGSMTARMFYNYVSNGLIPWLKREKVRRPVLFFVDCHASHMGIELSQVCEEEGVILYALPPKTTHLLQPAAVAIFSPLMAVWKQMVANRRLQPQDVNLPGTRADVAPFMQLALQQVASSTISDGFRECGLFPLDADAPDYGKLQPSQAPQSGASAEAGDAVDDSDDEQPSVVDQCDIQESKPSAAEHPFGTGRRSVTPPPVIVLKVNSSSPDFDSFAEEVSTEVPQSPPSKRSKPESLSPGASSSETHEYHESDSDAGSDLSVRDSPDHPSTSENASGSSRRSGRRTARRQDDDWRCRRCGASWEAEDAAGVRARWIECDSCSSTMHVKCIAPLHRAYYPYLHTASVVRFICEWCA